MGFGGSGPCWGSSRFDPGLASDGGTIGAPAACGKTDTAGKKKFQIDELLVTDPLCFVGAVIRWLSNQSPPNMNGVLFQQQCFSHLCVLPLLWQALWYYVQPPLEAMHAVATLCAQLSSQRLRSAGLLDALHDAASRSFGDARIHTLLRRLLRAAAAPYFVMLERWVGSGEVVDPYGEFLVQEDPVSLWIPLLGLL